MVLVSRPAVASNLPCCEVIFASQGFGPYNKSCSRPRRNRPPQKAAATRVSRTHVHAPTSD